MPEDMVDRSEERATTEQTPGPITQSERETETVTRETEKVERDAEQKKPVKQP